MPEPAATTKRSTEERLDRLEALAEKLIDLVAAWSKQVGMDGTTTLETPTTTVEFIRRAASHSDQKSAIENGDDDELPPLTIEIMEPANSNPSKPLENPQNNKGSVENGCVCCTVKHSLVQAPLASVLWLDDQLESAKVEVGSAVATVGLVSVSLAVTEGAKAELVLPLVSGVDMGKNGFNRSRCTEVFSLADIARMHWLGITEEISSIRFHERGMSSKNTVVQVVQYKQIGVSIGPQYDGMGINFGQPIRGKEFQDEPGGILILRNETTNDDNMVNARQVIVEMLKGGTEAYKTDAVLDKVLPNPNVDGQVVAMGVDRSTGVIVSQRAVLGILSSLVLCGLPKEFLGDPGERKALACRKEYIKAGEKAKKRLRGFIAAKYYAPLMFRFSIISYAGFYQLTVVGVAIIGVVMVLDADSSSVVNIVLSVLEESMQIFSVWSVSSSSESLPLSELQASMGGGDGVDHPASIFLRVGLFVLWILYKPTYGYTHSRVYCVPMSCILEDGRSSLEAVELLSAWEDGQSGLEGISYIMGLGLTTITGIGRKLPEGYIHRILSGILVASESLPSGAAVGAKLCMKELTYIDRVPKREWTYNDNIPYTSDYGYSVWIIVVVQILIVAVGCFATSFRWFRFFLHFSLKGAIPVKSYSEKSINHLLRTNPILRASTQHVFWMHLQDFAWYVILLARVFTIMPPIVVGKVYRAYMSRFCEPQVLLEDATTIGVGVDPWCVSVDTAQRWENVFARKQQALVQSSVNFVDEVWKDRPVAESKPVIIQPLEFAGQSVSDKLRDLREKLMKGKACGIIFTTLDEDAWLYNVLGSDVSYCPVIHASSIVTHDSAFFYVEKQKVSTEVLSCMEKNGIEVREYTAVSSDVSRIASGQLNSAVKDTHSIEAEATANGTSNLVWIDPGICCYALYSNLKPDQVLLQQSPLSLVKALKNHVELDGLRNAHIRDGAAVVQYLVWWDKQMQEMILARKAVCRIGDVTVAFHYTGATTPSREHSRRQPSYFSRRHMGGSDLPDNTFSCIPA